MSYKICYTADAKEDLKIIYEYIEKELLVPETAKKQIRRILDKVKGLVDFPMRHSLYMDEPWHSIGLRFLSVDNYLVFYLPDEKNNTVSIVRIMYGGRDVSKQLEK